MCCSSLQDHVRGIVIFNIVILCIDVLFQLAAIAFYPENTLLKKPIVIGNLKLYWWIVLIVLAVYILSLIAYVICYHGAKTRNKYKLIPFIFMKSVCLSGLTGVAMYFFITAYCKISYNLKFNMHYFEHSQHLLLYIVLMVSTGIVLQLYFLVTVVKFYQEINNDGATVTPTRTWRDNICYLSTCI